MSTYFETNISNLKNKMATGFTKLKDKGRVLKGNVDTINLENTLYSSPWYFGLLEILQYIIFIVIIYKYNPFNVTNNHPAFTNVLVLLVSFIYVALFYFLKESIPIGPVDVSKRKPTEMNFVMKTIKTIGAFIAFVFITLGAVWLFKHLSILTYLLHHGLLLLIILSTFGIIYILSKPYIDKAKSDPSSFASFLWNFTMFVPCLFVDVVNYVKDQYNITTKPIWLLLMFEIILIALWVVVPIVFHSILTHDGKQLLSDPIYLNEEKTLGNFENLHADNNNDKKNGSFKYRYSLSAWIYINPQPPNTSSAYTKYTSLLNYANKPNVQYNGKLNSLRVMAQTGKLNGIDATEGDLVEVFETKDIMYQKWNNIVINYDGGNMDVFLNGELVGSKPNIAPYMTYENITSGTKDGIHGGIRDVIYYNSIMKKSNIVLLNLLKTTF